MREPGDFYRDMKEALTVFAIQAIVALDADLPLELEEYCNVFLLNDEPARLLSEGIEHAIDLEPG
jgi:hypothetical protein